MKQICFFSDGTWFSKQTCGIIYKLYTLINGDNIVKQYNNGIGTQGCLCTRIMGGVCGTKLYMNIIQAFKFLSHNVNQEDDIFLFGYSRGAFTVRSLCGMLNIAGLPPLCTDQVANEAFRAYRNCDSQFKEKYCIEKWRKTPKIKLLVVLDTVGARGIPKMRTCFGKFLRKQYNKKYLFHNCCLGKNVTNALHVLAAHEDRKDFEPTLFLEDSRVLQVWFPGNHTDIGGNGSSFIGNKVLQFILEYCRKHIKNQSKIINNNRKISKIRKIRKISKISKISKIWCLRRKKRGRILPKHQKYTVIHHLLFSEKIWKNVFPTGYWAMLDENGIIRPLYKFIINDH